MKKSFSIGQDESDVEPVGRGQMGGMKPMKLRHFYPLLGFVVPTVVIGYGLVIPNSCIAGLNSQSVGFATTVVGACVTYWVGVRDALRRQ